MPDQSRHRVLYWSLTGHSARLARAVAASLGARAEAVKVPAYAGALGKMRMAVDFPAMRTPVLAPVADGLEGAETVTLCGPVWGGRLAPALRALLRLAELPARVGLALTCETAGKSTDMFRRAEAILGRPLAATLVLENRQEGTAAEGERVAAYASRLAP